MRWILFVGLMMGPWAAAEPPRLLDDEFVIYNEDGYPEGLRDLEVRPAPKAEAAPCAEAFYERWCGDGTCQDLEPSPE